MNTTTTPATGAKISINPANERMTSLIGQAMKVCGDIQGAEGVMVRGEVLGDIIISDDGPAGTGVVFVFSTGKVTGLVSGRRVVVAGEVDGPIIARDLLQVVETGVVRGDVYCVDIDAASASRVTGQVHRIETGENPIDEVQARRYA